MEPFRVQPLGVPCSKSSIEELPVLVVLLLRVNGIAAVLELIVRVVPALEALTEPIRLGWALITPASFAAMAAMVALLSPAVMSSASTVYETATSLTVAIKASPSS